MNEIHLIRFDDTRLAKHAEKIRQGSVRFVAQVGENFLLGEGGAQDVFEDGGVCLWKSHQVVGLGH